MKPTSFPPELGYYSDGELIEDPNAAQGLDIDPLSEESMTALQRLARYKPPPDPYPFPDGRAAVAVALFGSRNGTNLNVLLSTRAKNMRTYPGQVACPGGKMDPEDINLIATARREAWEEIGLPMDNTVVRYLTTLPPQLSRSMMLVTPVVFLILDYTLKPELNPAEVDTLFSFPLSGFLNDKVNPSIAKSTPPEVRAGITPYHISDTYNWFDEPEFPGVYHEFHCMPVAVTGLTAGIMMTVAKLAYGRPPDFDEGKVVPMTSVIRRAMKTPEWRGRIAKFNAVTPVSTKRDLEAEKKLKGRAKEKL